MMMEASELTCLLGFLRALLLGRLQQRLAPYIRTCIVTVASCTRLTCAQCYADFRQGSAGGI